MTEAWKDKVIFITGICGTIGQELLSQLTQMGAGEIIGIDNDESGLFYLDEAYKSSDQVRLYLGDIRDKSTLLNRLEGVNIVLHAGALKHVGLSEFSPRDTVQTNIIGTQNLIEAAQASGVEQVVFTSSDKAVNPTNVMGTSKLMGERLITAADSQRRGERPVYSSTRFGNVLGSMGSVVPLFKRQIAAGGPVTLTSPDMTRFVMTIEEAGRLILDSIFMAHGGEVFVTKMPTMNIEILAQVMIEELASAYGRKAKDIDIEIIGSRPGEKMYEELLSEEETHRTIETDRYFIIQPALKTNGSRRSNTYPGMLDGIPDRVYVSSSEPAMTTEEVRAYLREHKLLET